MNDLQLNRFSLHETESSCDRLFHHNLLDSQVGYDFIQQRAKKIHAKNDQYNKTIYINFPSDDFEDD